MLLDEMGSLAQRGWATEPLLAYDRTAIKASPLRIKEWDYYLVNDDLDSAVERIRNIMTAESLRVPEAVRQIIRQYEKEV